MKTPLKCNRRGRPDKIVEQLLKAPRGKCRYTGADPQLGSGRPPYFPLAPICTALYPSQCLQTHTLQGTRVKRSGLGRIGQKKRLHPIWRNGRCGVNLMQPSATVGPLHLHIHAPMAPLRHHHQSDNGFITQNQIKPISPAQTWKENWPMELAISTQKLGAVESVKTHGAEVYYTTASSGS